MDHTFSRAPDLVHGQPSRDTSLPTTPAIRCRSRGRERRRACIERAWMRSANSERILALAAYLPDRDRALIEAVYREGLLPSAVAALRRCTPLSIRRRVARLIARTQRPEFILAATHAHLWTPLRARVVKLCILEGIALRIAADRLGTSIHTVRRELESVHALAEAMRLAGRLPEPASQTLAEKSA